MSGPPAAGSSASSDPAGRAEPSERPAERSPSPESEAAGPPDSYEIVFELPDGAERSVRCDAEEHILDAARKQGVELPSSCEQGWDMACAVRILAGSVDNSDARRYFDEDREAGFALICTARPRSELRLQTHQSEAMRRHRREHGLPAPGGAWGSS